MVLMHAVARVCEWSAGALRDVPARVLTFDHGTGPAASAAAALVAREGSRLGFEVCSGRALVPAATEAEWRAARWRFFREAALPGARVATAHTRDDQLETVVMRVMRDAGARGLAGLAADSPHVARPFLRLAREAIRRIWQRSQHSVCRRSVECVAAAPQQSCAARPVASDRPGPSSVCCRDARRWPSGAADGVTRSTRSCREFVSESVDGGVIRVAREELATYDSATLCVLWPAIAARASGHPRSSRNSTSGTVYQFGRPRGSDAVVGGRRGLSASRLFRSSPFVTAAGGGLDARSIGVVLFGEWRFWPVPNAQGRDERTSQ